jgi:hypothetical protein
MNMQVSVLQHSAGCRGSAAFSLRVSAVTGSQEYHRVTEYRSTEQYLHLTEYGICQGTCAAIVGDGCKVIRWAAGSGKASVNETTQHRPFMGSI